MVPRVTGVKDHIHQVAGERRRPAVPDADQLLARVSGVSLQIAWRALPLGSVLAGGGSDPYIATRVPPDYL
jgi:hypothetical protein